MPVSPFVLCGNFYRRGELLFARYQIMANHHSSIIMHGHNFYAGE